VRDMAWRQWKNHLSATIKQLYEEGIRLLVGEIAATQDIEFADADTQFRARLKDLSLDKARNAGQMPG
jgi:RNA polymerase-interacting CarD/CdnL/TRCF family regulator